MRAYQARLDEVVGPDGWSVGYRTLGDRAVICRLTVLGIAREDVGEADPETCSGPRSGNANAWTSAVAQSFKRACASFGLGRYLYSLPRLWAEYDPQKKALKAPQTIVERMYRGKPGCRNANRGEGWRSPPLIHREGKVMDRDGKRPLPPLRQRKPQAAGSLVRRLPSRMLPGLTPTPVPKKIRRCICGSRI